MSQAIVATSYPKELPPVIHCTRTPTHLEPSPPAVHKSNPFQERDDAILVKGTEEGRKDVGRVTSWLPCPSTVAAGMSPDFFPSPTILTSLRSGTPQARCSLQAGKGAPTPHHRPTVLCHEKSTPPSSFLLASESNRYTERVERGEFWFFSERGRGERGGEGEDVPKIKKIHKSPTL